STHSLVFDEPRLDRIPRELLVGAAFASGSNAHCCVVYSRLRSRLPSAETLCVGHERNAPALGTIGAVRNWVFGTSSPGAWGFANEDSKYVRGNYAMKILFATPETSDFIQVGGLAAVSAALPRALRDYAEIRVVIPGYSEVLAGLQDFTIVGRCAAFAGLPAFDIGMGRAPDGLAYYVIVCPGLFERIGTPYGDERGVDWSDNDVRFATFSYGAASIALGRVDKTWSADLVHANDWQCALIPGYLEWLQARLPTVFTIHNLAYQGVFDRRSMPQLGIPDASFHMNGVEFYDRLSFIKAGLVYASHLTTVSQTYAREITTSEFGCGLDGILKQRAEKNELSGILNGIDESWDPRTCSSLSRTFDAGDWERRSENANEVRRQFGLALSRGPLFALVARLVHQKGVDLVLENAKTIIDRSEE